MSKIVIATLLLAGCAHLEDPAGTSSDSGALDVALAGAPAGIDCINFSFADEDGVTTNVQRALNVSNLTIRNLAAGAYSLSAQAYASGAPQPVGDGDCAAVPLASPWATETPLTVVIEPGLRTTTDLRLVETGRATIHPVFADTPQVIAQGQHALGLVAAGGGQVAWIVAGNSATSSIVEVDDVPRAIPHAIATAQTNPSEIVIDPATRVVYWTNSPSGARDADGNRITDGSVWQYDGTTATALRTNTSPTDLQVAGDDQCYWGAFETSSIERSGGPALAVGQAQPNAVTAHGARVYWDNGNTGEVFGMSVTDLAPTRLAVDTNKVPYGMAADDTALYLIDQDDTTGGSSIASLPIGGGPIATLVPDLAGAFPIAVLDGYLYWVDGARIARVPTTGGATEDVVNGVLGGFAVDHDAAGHGVLYWTDNTHGGLVWRGRVN